MTLEYAIRLARTISVPTESGRTVAAMDEREISCMTCKYRKGVFVPCG